MLSDPDQEDNSIVYVKKAFEKITSYSKEETAGLNCRFFHGQQKRSGSVTEKFVTPSKMPDLLKLL